MTNDLMLGGVYILMAIMLVLGSLMARREPLAKLLTMALAWVAIFAAGFVLFTFRDDFGWVAQRLKAEALGTPVQQGRETRIPMAIDGHFWVDAKLNGQRRQLPGRQRRDDDDHRPRRPRSEAGVDVSPRARPISSAPATASSACRAARADELEVGGIVRQRRRRCRSPTTTISTCSG